MSMTASGSSTALYAAFAVLLQHVTDTSQVLNPAHIAFDSRATSFSDWQQGSSRCTAIQLGAICYLQMSNALKVC